MNFPPTTIYVFIFTFMLYIHTTSKKYSSIIFITRLCLESMLIQTSELLWIRIRTSVLDSLPCLRQSFCQWHLIQAPPKQSAVCSICIIPAQPANCQFIWMVSAFAMSATNLSWDDSRPYAVLQRTLDEDCRQTEEPKQLVYEANQFHLGRQR